jgi:hypothetical protein
MAEFIQLLRQSVAPAQFARRHPLRPSKGRHRLVVR